MAGRKIKNLFEQSLHSDVLQSTDCIRISYEEMHQLEKKIGVYKKEVKSGYDFLVDIFCHFLLASVF